MACMAATASAAIGVQTYPLPSGYSVSPRQGLIELDGGSLTGSPLGATEVTITFSGIKSLEVNKACPDPVEIYVDGSETPTEQVYAKDGKNVYADGMGFMMASVHFNHKYVDPGLFRIVIPAGVFFCDGEPSEPLELGYEIYIPQEVTPAPGTYTALSEWIMTFPDYNEVKFLSPGSFYLQGSLDADRGGTDDYTFKAEIVEREGVDPNTVKLTLSLGDRDNLTATKPGTYQFSFPAGSIQLTKYGPQYYENPEDKVVEMCPTILLHYHIQYMDKPQIDPEEGIVTGFRSFKVTYPDNFDIEFSDDKQVNVGVFKMLLDGTIGQDKVYHVLCQTNVNKPHEATFQLVYWKDGADGEAGTYVPYRSAQNPGPGRYAFVIPGGYFMGYLTTDDKRELINSDPVSFVYTILPETFKAEVAPADGSTLDALAEIVMTFPVAENLDVNAACTAEATVTDADGKEVEGVQVLVDVPGAISPLAEGGAEGGDTTIKAYVTLVPEIVKKGTYTVTVPVGKFVSGEFTSDEYKYTYNVTGNLSSVEELGVDASDAPVYNVLGQRVDASYKGIVIRAGKKFIQR